MTFKTYPSKETVKARQVTDKDGESVVTSQGPMSVQYRDYVIDTGDGITVMSRDVFETRYRVGATRKTAAKKPAAKKAVAKKSAAERVKAAR